MTALVVVGCALGLAAVYALVAGLVERVARHTWLAHYKPPEWIEETASHYGYWTDPSHEFAARDCGWLWPFVLIVVTVRYGLWSPLRYGVLRPLRLLNVGLWRGMRALHGLASRERQKPVDVPAARVVRGGDES